MLDVTIGVTVKESLSNCAQEIIPTPGNFMCDLKSLSIAGHVSVPVSKLSDARSTNIIGKPRKLHKETLLSKPRALIRGIT